MFTSYPDFDALEENTVATLLQRMSLYFVNLYQTLNVFYTMAAGEKKSFDLLSCQRGVHMQVYVKMHYFVINFCLYHSNLFKS